MEIWPLKYKPKQESLIASLKRVRANDVYQKSLQIKQQAKLCVKKVFTEPERPEPHTPSSGQVCSHHTQHQQSLLNHNTHHGSMTIQSNVRGGSSGNNLSSKTKPQQQLSQQMQVIETKLESCSSGNNQLIGKSAYPIGLHVGNSQGQILDATSHFLHEQQYSRHFQNVKLAKELAQSRTISLDRVVGESGTRQLQASTTDKYSADGTTHVRISGVSGDQHGGTRHTILSRREVSDPVSFVSPHHAMTASNYDIIQTNNGHPPQDSHQRPEQQRQPQQKTNTHHHNHHHQHQYQQSTFKQGKNQKQLPQSPTSSSSQQQSAPPQQNHSHQQTTTAATNLPNEQRKQFVNAEILGSLKSGYGFLPNFSQPNNQGSRVRRTSTSGPNEIKTAPNREVLNHRHCLSHGDPSETHTDRRIRTREDSATTPELCINSSTPTPDNIAKNNERIKTLNTVEANGPPSHQLSSVHSMSPHREHESTRAEARKRLPSTSAIELVLYTGRSSQEHQQQLLQQLQQQPELYQYSPRDEDLKPSNLAQKKNKRAASQYHQSRNTSIARPKTQAQRSSNRMSSQQQNDRQQQQHQAIDFNSQSLYDRYNKLLFNQTLQTHQTTSRSRGDNSPIYHRKSLNQNPGKLGRKKRRSISKQDVHLRENQATSLMIKQQDKKFKLKQYDFTSQSDMVVAIDTNSNALSKSFGKTNSRGVPMQKKKDGVTLKQREPVDQPISSGGAAADQMNFQVKGQKTRHVNLIGSPHTTTKMMQEAELMKQRQMNEMGMQTQQQEYISSRRVTEFEIIKGVEQIINFTDNASDGTNRLSTTQFNKKKLSKLSVEPRISNSLENNQPQTQQQQTQQKQRCIYDNTNDTPDREDLKESQGTSELHCAQQDTRRSIEFQQMHSGSGNANIINIRADTKSKSIDSYQTGGISNIHDIIMRPKGIEVYPLGLGATPLQGDSHKKDNANDSIVKIPDTPLSNIHESKIDHGTNSHIQLLLSQNIDEKKNQTQQLPLYGDASEDFKQTFGADQLGSYAVSALLPQNLEDVKSGEVVTAKLASSDSDRKKVSRFNSGTVEDGRKFNSGEKPNDAEDEDFRSHASFASSLKTSIDDETITELAKKGIHADTPRRKGGTAVLTKTASVDKIKTSVVVISPPETDESQVYNEHMRLQPLTPPSQQSKDRKDLSIKHKSNMLVVEKNLGVNSRGAPRNKQSTRSIIYQQFDQQLQQASKDIQQNNQESEKQPIILNVGTLNTPRNHTIIDEPKAANEATMICSAPENHRNDEILTFTTQMQKGDATPVPQQQRAEMEAQSQTDFAPIAPLDPLEFSLEGINGNYDTNLSFIPQLQGGVQRQITFDNRTQPNSMLSNSQDIKEKNNSALSKNLQTPMFDVSATGFIHQTYQQQIGQMSPSSAQTKFKLEINPATNTEHVISQFTSPDLMQLHAPQGFKIVKIKQSGPERNAPSQFQLVDKRVYYAQKRVRGDEQGEKGKIIRAASMGKRIIYKKSNPNAEPKVMNLRPQEQISSPEKHYLIQLQGQPLQAVALKDRTRKMKDDQLIKIKNIPELRNQAMNLSRDFKKFTKSLLNINSAPNVADKNIGDSMSNGPGSQEISENRKYYILNIDNNENEDGAANKSRSSKIGNMSGIDKDQQAIFQPTIQNSEISQQVHNPNSFIDHKTIIENLEGVITDRQLDSDLNSPGTTVEQLQQQSARNNPHFHSRQEDLETVYMQSTMHFNKDLMGSYRIASKSPDPNSMINMQTVGVLSSHDPRYTAMLSSRASLSRDEEYINVSNQAQLDSGRRLSVGQVVHPGIQPHHHHIHDHPFARDETIGQIERRRQIQLTHAGQPGDVRQVSELDAARVSGKKRLNSQVDDHNRQHYQALAELAYFGKKNGHQIQILDETTLNTVSKFGNQVATSDYNNSIRFRDRPQVEKIQTQEIGNSTSDLQKYSTVAQQNNQQKATITKNAQSDVDSFGSLQKLYPTVAAIQVNRSRHFSPISQTKIEVQDTKAGESKKARPKTSENYSKKRQMQCNKHLGLNQDSPRSRKIVYLMHKRKEIAMRRTMLSTAQSDMVNVAERGKGSSTIAATAKEASAVDKTKLSFFEKVSEQMSRAFTLDRTSTRMASTMMTNKQNDDSKSNTNLSKSQGRTTQQKSKHRMQLMLTINPVSNSSLQTRQSVVNLRAGRNHHRNNYWKTNKDIETSGSMVNPFQNPAFLQAQDYNKVVASGADNLRYDLQNSHGFHTIEQDQLLFDAFVEQTKKQRVGLKTADGRQRGEQYLSNLNNKNSNNNRVNRKAVLSNPTIDKNDKFIGFDRRQTHDITLQKINKKIHQQQTVMTAGNTLDSGEYQNMTSNHNLDPTLLKRESLMSARLNNNKPPMSPQYQKQTIKQSSPPKKRTLIDRKETIKQNSASTEKNSGRTKSAIEHDSLKNSMKDLTRDKLVTGMEIREQILKPEMQSFSHQLAKSHQRVDDGKQHINKPPSQKIDSSEMKIQMRQVVHASTSAADYDIVYHKNLQSQASSIMAQTQRPKTTTTAKETMLQTAVRKQARERSQGVTYKKNQVLKMKMKQQKIAATATAKTPQVRSLVQSVSGNVFNFNFGGGGRLNQQ